MPRAAPRRRALAGKVEIGVYETKINSTLFMGVWLELDRDFVSYRRIGCQEIYLKGKELGGTNNENGIGYRKNTSYSHARKGL